LIQYRHTQTQYDG